jgi:hypothetical protein
MTNPTTPFGWQMPTSTDLVTDLPADFETFGQAVATSMADLLGGTTGQVLAKASNTNMDFTWVAQDDSNAIQNAIVDAKGDLIAASANDTPARLAVGANGETLVADSAATTGLRYQGSMAGGKNAVINGGFDIWQRGTSFTTLNNYIADRWYWGGAGTGRTISRQTGTAGMQYAIRLQRDSGNTSANAIAIGSSMEIAQATPYQGKTITVSFYAKAGANYSGTSNQLTVQLSTGTSSTEANRMLVAYASGDATPLNDVATLTTSWQRFSYNVTLASNVTQFFLYFQTAILSGTAGAADFVDITGAQIEVGSVATNFTRAGGTIQGELAACQRYFVRWGGSTIYEALANAQANSTTGVSIYPVMPVPMRIPPSSVASNAVAFYDTVTVFAVNTPVLNTNINGTKMCQIGFSGASGLTQFRYGTLIANNSTSAYLDLNAEL